MSKCSELIKLKTKETYLITYSVLKQRTPTHYYSLFWSAQETKCFHVVQFVSKTVDNQNGILMYCLAYFQNESWISPKSRLILGLISQQVKYIDNS